MVAPVLANFAMAVARKGAIAVSPTLTDLEKVGIREGRLRGVARGRLPASSEAQLSRHHGAIGTWTYHDPLCNQPRRANPCAPES